MANNENLKPQKSGEPSHNPSGRGKGNLNKATYAKMAMDAFAPKEINKKFGKNADLELQLFGRLAMAMRDGKESEAISAVKEIFDRTEGKAIARVEQTVEDVTPPTKIMIVDLDNDDSEDSTPTET